MLGCIMAIFKGEKAYKGEKVAAPFKGEKVKN